MLAVFVAIVLLAVSVWGLYLLLKNMGENGIEAAAPGSCRSGRCGVQPKGIQSIGVQSIGVQPKSSESSDYMIQNPYVQIAEFKRPEAAPTAKSLPPT
jgi:hypothetical protein